MIPTYNQHCILEVNTVLKALLELPWLEVTEARKEYFMSTMPRTYLYGKGKGEREYKSSPFDETVGDILEKLNDALDAHFNVCFLNRYDDQGKHLGWHSDDSPTMDKDHPIAVISFGAVREIWWRKIGETGVTPQQQRQLLHNGSLFVMPAGFQEVYQHRIPKCDHLCEVRVSLTFRRYK